MKTICILIPVYNEETVLPALRSRLTQVLDALPRYQFRVLFVNDGSTDQSLALLKAIGKEDGRFHTLSLSRNFGKEAAVAAGLDACREDALILLDADLQDPPELIPQLIEEWENGYDDVYAKRTSRQGETFLKKFTSKLYYRLLSRLSRVPIQVDTGDFRLLDRRVVEALCSLRESGRCSKSLFSWVGFRKKEVPFERAPRHAGKTKWNYGSLCSLALDGITGLTTFPLRLPLFIGIGLLLLSGFYLLALPIISLLGHGLPAETFLYWLILTLSGAQFCFLGIFGEYLARLAMDGKGRPLYLIDSYDGEKVEAKAVGGNQ